MNRRTFLTAAAAATPAALLAKPRKAEVNFVFGTYGMKSLSTRDAVLQCAEIGYDGLQPCLIPGWTTDPAVMTPIQRKDFRSLLQDKNLAVPAVLESLPLVGTPQKRAYNLERLKLAAEFLNELSPGRPPVLDTILGLKTTDYDQARGRMAEELRDWAKVAEDAKMTIAIKPHAAQAIHSAARALELLKDVGSPRIAIVYDYSHFYLEGFPLEESFHQLFSRVALVSVKDAKGTPAKHDYLLPGEGATDYNKYFRLLVESGYRGPLSVEVSALIHRKPGYEPIPTAKLCYSRLAPIFEACRLTRTRKRIV